MEISYIGLFLSSFLAATLFPAQSELVLSALLLMENQPVWALISIATIGNTLGSLVNWTLGRFFHIFQDKSWFPIKNEKLVTAETWYRKYGRWSLLLSWVPIIGDPLTLIAGLLKEPLPSFLFLVFVAKLGRYLVVAGVVTFFV